MPQPVIQLFLDLYNLEHQKTLNHEKGVENQVEQRRLCVELESCLEKLSLLENQTAILNANLVEMRESNSWKITKPLRWFSRLIKSMRVSES